MLGAKPSSTVEIIQHKVKIGSEYLYAQKDIDWFKDSNPQGNSFTFHIFYKLNMNQRANESMEIASDVGRMCVGVCNLQKHFERAFNRGLDFIVIAKLTAKVLRCVYVAKLTRTSI